MTHNRVRFYWKGFLQGGLLLLIGAAFCIYKSIIPMVCSMSLESWPAASAVVVKAHTTKSYSQQRTKTYYHFTYRYVVDGKPYTSDRYSFRYASGSPSEGVARFSPKEVITVNYHPDHPSIAVAEKVPAGFFVYAFFGLGCIFLLMGAGMTFLNDPFSLLLALFSLFGK